MLFASCKKNQKARQRFANLWTPGTIQSSAGSEFAKLSGGSFRNRFCLQNGGEKALNRCERVTVVQTQDRCFCEKEKVYCKLTVASDIQKGLLHVSLGAVGRWSFCALKQGLQNLVSPCKGFNCCGAKPPLRRAKSKFAKPRNFLRKRRFSCFSLVRKEPKVHQRFANLWTPGTIQSSAGSEFAKFSGGFCRNRFCLQTAGEKALNRCERVAVLLTQD